MKKIIAAVVVASFAAMSFNAAAAAPGTAPMHKHKHAATAHHTTHKHAAAKHHTHKTAHHKKHT